MYYSLGCFVNFPDDPTVFHPDILAMGGKVEFWECEGGKASCHAE